MVKKLEKCWDDTSWCRFTFLLFFVSIDNFEKFQRKFAEISSKTPPFLPLLVSEVPAREWVPEWAPKESSCGNSSASLFFHSSDLSSSQLLWEPERPRSFHCLQRPLSVSVRSYDKNGGKMLKMEMIYRGSDDTCLGAGHDVPSMVEKYGNGMFLYGGGPREITAGEVLR